MTEVVRGSIADRTWGLTFGQFGLRQVTGTLTVQALDGRAHMVAFDQGAIIGAVSPQVADSATRIALTAGLITSPQVAMLQKQIVARASEDDVDVLIEVCKLDPIKALKLRRKAITQRAARTFSIENGSFSLDDQLSIPTSYDASVDVRAVIYQGARLGFSETRLVSELRDLGAVFILGPNATESFDWFGFEDSDRPIFDALKTGASVADIEAANRDLDPRRIQAVVYSLVVYRQATPTADSGPARKASRPGVSVSFKSGGSADPVPPQVTPAGSAPMRAASPSGSQVARPTTPTMPSFSRPATPSSPRPPVTITKSRVPIQDDSTPISASRTSTLKGAPNATENRRPSDPSIALGLPGLEEEPTGSRNLIGIDQGPPPMPELVTPRTMTPLAGMASTPSPFASPEEPTLRTTLSRTTTASGAPTSPPLQPKPTALAASASGSFKTVTPSDSGSFARTKTGSGDSGSFPRPKTASVDPSASGSFPRPKTSSASPTIARTISQSSGTPMREFSEGSDRVTQSLDEAADAYKRGRAALDANQPEVALEALSRAATLNPHEFEYTAIHAYAQFLCATPAERTKSADKVRKMLSHATQKSNDPEQARFFLARIERLLDRKKEAVALLQQVIKAVPNHAGAAAELQDIEDKAVEKAGLGGLFGRKKTT